MFGHRPTPRTSAPDIRAPALIALWLGVIVAGCRAVPEVDTLVTIVNQSTSPVVVTTTKDGQAVDAFHSPFEGCALDRIGFDSGTVEIVVTSATDRGELSFRSLPTTPPIVRTIVIDPAGGILVNSPEWPANKEPC